MLDPRTPEQVRHGLTDIIRFRLMMLAAGHEDGNDAAALRRDPAFKLALDRLADGGVGPRLVAVHPVADAAALQRAVGDPL